MESHDTQHPLAAWRRIDRELNLGQTSVDEAIERLFNGGLVRKANHYLSRQTLDTATRPGQLVFLEPHRERPIPGPVILLDWGNLYGGRRLYYPLSGELRCDAGAYSIGPWIHPEEATDARCSSERDPDTGEDGADEPREDD